MSDDGSSKIVAFRLSPGEYKEAERIAILVSENGKIRNDSVNTLAKACLFTRINEWKQIEFEQEIRKQREEALKARNIPPKGYANV